MSARNRSAHIKNKGDKMIALAIIKNGNLYAYDRNNRQIFVRPASGLTLLGFNSTSISVRSKTTIFIYNEKGQQISSRPV